MVQTVNSVREPYLSGSRTELTVQKNGIRQQGRMHSSINKNAILVVERICGCGALKIRFFRARRTYLSCPTNGSSREFDIRSTLCLLIP